VPEFKKFNNLHHIHFGPSTRKQRSLVLFAHFPHFRAQQTGFPPVSVLANQQVNHSQHK